VYPRDWNYIGEISSKQKLGSINAHIGCRGYEELTFAYPAVPQIGSTVVSLGARSTAILLGEAKAKMDAAKGWMLLKI
jgi:hypothetical protein